MAMPFLVVSAFEVIVTPSRMLLLTLFLLSFAACDNTFSPKTTYEDRIVVFCILDKNAPFQTVRLESTYDAELTSPDKPIGKKDIETATVSIRNDQGVHLFRDTIVTNADGSQKRVWINRTLLPTEGRTYTLWVDVPGFERITAQTTVPSRAYLQIQTSDMGVRLTSVTNVAAPATAFLFRMWVVGKRVEGGTEVEVRREVPHRFNSATGLYEYANPSRQTQSVFPTSNLVYAQGQLQGLDGVTGQDVVGTAYSLDQYLYSYFQLVRGFDDPTSYRLDRPDISNITNGVGIFGAMYTDSLRTRYNAVIQ
jgi:hypothetical protein